MANNKYYVVYWSPVQVGSMIYTGGHPLLPDNYDKIVTGIVRKINIANGLNLPKESVCITWVTEMPSEPMLEPEFVKTPKVLPKSLDEVLLL